jgi:LysR family transcriptional regulator, transcription activator of glutamate synthase operon
MDLNRLRYFCQIIECKSLTQASELLHVAQPYLSRTLAQLENEMGHPLFDRQQGKRTTANKYGLALYVQARAALKALDKIKSSLDEMDTDLSGRIILTIEATVPGLGQVIADLCAEHPSIHINILTSDVDGSAFEYESDLTISSKQDTKRATHFVHLCKERFLVVVPRNTSAGDTLLSLHHAMFIFPTMHNGDRMACDAFCSLAGFVPRVAAEAVDTSQMLSMLETDMHQSLCALWPENRLNNLSADWVRLIQPRDVDTSRWINLYWPMQKLLTPVLEMFIHSLMRHYNPDCSLQEISSGL